MNKYYLGKQACEKKETVDCLYFYSDWLTDENCNEKIKSFISDKTQGELNFVGSSENYEAYYHPIFDTGSNYDAKLEIVKITKSKNYFIVPDKSNKE